MEKNKIILDNYFSRYKQIEKDIFLAEQEYQILLEKKGAIVSTKFGSDIRNKYIFRSGIDNILIKLEDKQNLLQKFYEDKEECRKEYIEDFKKLSSPKYTALLIQYYLDHKSLQYIAINFNCSLSYLKKMKAFAIEELIKMIPNDTK